MAKYTTEVRSICETYAGLTTSVGYAKIGEVIEKSREKIFDFDFPIFDENYRSVLETKILKHYYTREIGEETVGLWKFRLDTKLNEIMPFYNKLYNSELLEFNPLYNSNIERKGTKDLDSKKEETEKIRDTDGNSTSTDTTYNTHNNSTNRDLYSDTPQGALDGVEAETYLTNARKVTDVNDGKSDSHSFATADSHYNRDRNNGNNLTSTEDYLETVKGYSGTSASDLIMKYRETFLNIDMMVIKELEPIFFGLW